MLLVVAGEGVGAGASSGVGVGAGAGAVGTGMMSSAACFDAPSWYELVVEGRKVAGSAQMRHKGAVLQHGSVLLELDVEQLLDCCGFLMMQ